LREACLRKEIGDSKKAFLSIVRRSIEETTKIPMFCKTLSRIK
tara:strand:+ start:1658 stop:1786 length:129 start_codon:yes stop_codon:yes gene_type:complete